MRMATTGHHYTDMRPRYISGTSGGSIVCAVVGMYTDEELLNDIIREDIAKRYGVSWFEPMASQVLHFATRGVLMDNGFFANTCKACTGF